MCFVNGEEPASNNNDIPSTKDPKNSNSGLESKERERKTVLEEDFFDNPNEQNNNNVKGSSLVAESKYIGYIYKKGGRGKGIKITSANLEKIFFELKWGDKLVKVGQPRLHIEYKTENNKSVLGIFKKKGEKPFKINYSRNRRRIIRRRDKDSFSSINELLKYGERIVKPYYGIPAYSPNFIKP